VKENNETPDEDEGETLHKFEVKEEVDEAQKKVIPIRVKDEKEREMKKSKIQMKGSTSVGIESGTGSEKGKKAVDGIFKSLFSIFDDLFRSIGLESESTKTTGTKTSGVSSPAVSPKEPETQTVQEVSAPEKAPEPKLSTMSHKKDIEKDIDLEKQKELEELQNG